MSKIINVIGIICMLGGLVFGFLWLDRNDGKYEPYTYILGTLAGISFGISNWIRNSGRIYIGLRGIDLRTVDTTQSIIWKADDENEENGEFYFHAHFEMIVLLKDIDLIEFNAEYFKDGCAARNYNTELKIDGINVETQDYKRLKKTLRLSNETVKIDFERRCRPITRTHTPVEMDMGNILVSLVYVHNGRRRVRDFWFKYSMSHLEYRLDSVKEPEPQRFLKNEKIKLLKKYNYITNEEFDLVMQYDECRRFQLVREESVPEFSKVVDTILKCRHQEIEMYKQKGI